MAWRNSLRHFCSFLFCFISSGLLVLSFPIWDLSIFVWIALVPLLLALTGQTLRRGFILGYVHGMLFLPGVFNWILQIPNYKWYHHALLGVYFSAYFGLFGLIFTFITKRVNLSMALWSAPFLWVSLEYIRSNFFFLALPWGLLSHTQYHHTAVIQIASLFGTYSVSFLIVLVNVALLVMARSVATFYKNKSGQSEIPVIKKSDFVLIVFTGLAVLLTLFYGHNAISRPISGPSLEVALIQGNIEQAIKWDPRYAEEIIQIHLDLSHRAALKNPALIIWPETATPGMITLTPKIYNRVKDLVQTTAIPLVFGSARHRKFQPDESEGLKMANSAFLMVPAENSINIQRYDKIKLFPFGEYLPAKNILPWKWIGVSSLGEYVSGVDYKIFELSQYRFGVTICWENIFPDLVRQFATRGAQFIINITNEGRFGKTAAPRQLLAISIFRAIENGIFIIRCGNTGVSCIIDSHGRITKRFQDETGQDLFIRGILNGKIIPIKSNTFYTRKGDLAIPIVIALSLVFIFIAWFTPLTKRRSPYGAESH